MNTISLLAAIAMLALASPAAAAAERSPEMLARPCAGCHGTDGVSAGPTTANLAGQPAAYIVAAMKAFKSGERPATIMGRLARAYDDADFAAIGEFYARQPFARTGQRTDAAKAARGAKLHQRLCAECHKDGGRCFEYEGRTGPALAGQWIDYLMLSIDQFFSRDRDMPTGMGLQFLKLGTGDVEALAHFYASQQ